MIKKLIPAEYRLAAKLIALVGMLVGAFMAGHEWRDRACDLTVSTMEADAEKAAKEASEAARNVEQLQGELTEKNAESFELQRQLRAAQEETVEVEVIRYVTNTDPAGRCVLSDRWLRIDAASAAGTDHVPEADPGADGGSAR